MSPAPGKTIKPPTPNKTIAQDMKYRDAHGGKGPPIMKPKVDTPKPPPTTPKTPTPKAQEVRERAATDAIKIQMKHNEAVSALESNQNVLLGKMDDVINNTDSVRFPDTLGKLKRIRKETKDIDADYELRKGDPEKLKKLEKEFNAVIRTEPALKDYLARGGVWIKGKGVQVRDYMMEPTTPPRVWNFIKTAGLFTAVGGVMYIVFAPESWLEKTLDKLPKDSMAFNILSFFFEYKWFIIIGLLILAGVLAYYLWWRPKKFAIERTAGMI